MTFAEKLRELRDAKGLSEAKLAEASGVAFGALHFYGLGRRKPSFANVVKLARALGVDCTAFADCDDVTGRADDKGKPRAKRRNVTGKGQGRRS
jgi:transcriptional regulator with XRE-family HTH domain